MKGSKLFKSLMATLIVIILGGPTVVLADTRNFFEEFAKTTVSYADLDLERETFSNVVDKFNSAHIECMHAKLVAKGY